MAGLKSWNEKHERWRERQREWDIEAREARQERKAEERQAKEAVRAGNKKAYDRAYSAKRRADDKAAREAAREPTSDEAAAMEAALADLDLDPVKSIAEIERRVAAQAQIRLRLLTEAVKVPPPHLSHRLRQLKGGEQNIVEWWAVRERLVQNGEDISYGICASCRSQISTTGEEFSRARAQNAYKTIAMLEELGVWPRPENGPEDSV
ncbi:MAG TPA: hypothetical protein VK961_20850 [Chthoniobacter sp.]|nr:hypothetical protein [Chthoniobacter sp.]